ncbi:tyrosine-type recombinase/integrase [Shimia aestuarii]|uniref:tyrosine-type recombinase/integrase n=1 Tax=Shimia aestuarii TaxID=254406 RepID=UPI001FB2CD20|nr:tyrosine-type recombinase/integrase [Shimia aestuarii]
MPKKNHLNDPQKLRALPPRSAPYWDTLQYCRHIGVEIRADRRIWLARVRTKEGKYRQAQLASFDDCPTYDEALIRAEIWFSSPEVSRLASNPYPLGVRRELTFCPYGGVFTIGHALYDYVEWKRMAATQNYFVSLVNRINFHLYPRLGWLPAEELTPNHITEFSRQILSSPPKRGNQKVGRPIRIETLSSEALRKRKKTLNALIAILRGALKMAWENRKFEDIRVWKCLKNLPNQDRPRVEFLSRSECKSLLENARPEIKQLILAGLYTGCRISELASMRVRDVATEGYGVRIFSGKNRRSHFVFLPDEGLAFFLACVEGKESNDLVFTNPQGLKWEGSQKAHLKEAVAAADLPSHISFHVLRHTYATQLVQAGVPLSVIAQQLGHASADTVSRTYGHLAPQYREAIIRSAFSSVDANNKRLAKSMEGRLTDLWENVQTPNWRDYGKTEDDWSWPRSNFYESREQSLGILPRRDE